MSKIPKLTDPEQVDHYLSKLIKAASRHPEDDDLYESVESVRLIVRRQQNLIKEAHSIIEKAKQTSKSMTEILEEMKQNGK